MYLAPMALGSKRKKTQPRQTPVALVVTATSDRDLLVPKAGRGRHSTAISLVFLKQVIIEIALQHSDRLEQRKCLARLATGALNSALPTNANADEVRREMLTFFADVEQRLREDRQIPPALRAKKR
jgi:hypothetical protein